MNLDPNKTISTSFVGRGSNEVVEITNGVR